MEIQGAAPAAESISTPKASGCSTGGCSTGSCGTKMNTFDWLAYEGLAELYPPTDLLEVRFKGGRKEFFRNSHRLNLVIGDAIAVEASQGFHVGYVSLTGPLVELQMRKKKVETEKHNLPRVLRLANNRDLEKLDQARNRELPSLFRTRQIIQEQKLPMKLSDIEYMADGLKATFYYSSEHRVDFRDLVRNLATEFKVRVDMRQISLRQEAGRLGGIGVCGRELCCSTWLTDFKSVSTSAARYQNLSLNPLKLSGQCGRLKCCLNYELDTYMTEMADMPKVEKPLQTEKGEAYLIKTDIFRKLLWFSYKGDNSWIELNTDRVKAIQNLNKVGQKALALTEQEELDMKSPDDAMPINSDLKQMDDRFRKRDRQDRDRRPGPRKDGQAPRAQQAGPTQPGRGSQRPNQGRGPQATGRPNQEGNQNPQRRKDQNNNRGNGPSRPPQPPKGEA